MEHKVLNFVQKREENIAKKRRGFERLMFANFLGAYSVFEQDGILYPVDLLDISKSGCQIEMPWPRNESNILPQNGEFVARIYFSKDSYIPIVLNIKRSYKYRSDDGVDYLRYGCEFDTTMKSFEAMQSFIDFMYKYAEHSALDRGDNKAMFY